MKNQDGNTDSPKLTEQIIREFGIDLAEIPNWESLSLGQLYALLSCHPSLNELYNAGEDTERNRRIDVLNDLRVMWDYQESGGAPTPDELKRYGEAAWTAIAEIVRSERRNGRWIYCEQFSTTRKRLALPLHRIPTKRKPSSSEFSVGGKRIAT